MYVVYLLRRGAQKEAAKPKNGVNNETCCNTITHGLNYTNKIPYCNKYFKIFPFHVLQDK